MTLGASFGDLSERSQIHGKAMGLGDVLLSGVIGRSRRSIGGSHTVVTYPPLDALPKYTTHPTVRDILTDVHGIHLYAHIAFCEFQCPFCHYETAHRKLDAPPDERTTQYMRSLSWEWESWARQLVNSSLASIYVGGGTPTSVPLHELLELLKKFLAFRREPAFRFCVEVSPSTIGGREGARKLRELTDLGVNRFSLGVQTTNEISLRRTRGHGRATVDAAVENLNATGVEFNIDLIQDLPNQNDASLIEDLKFVAWAQPQQVTWYIMRLERNAAWSHHLDQNRLDVAGSFESARRRLLLIDGMNRLGYRLRPGGRFVKRASVIDTFKATRAGLTDTLLGLGASAYSHGWGHFFRNVHTSPGTNGIREYVDRVSQGHSPVATGHRLATEDYLASTCVTGIRDRLELTAAFNAAPLYLDHVTRTLTTLASAGLVDRHGATFALSSLGLAFEEEICAMLYPEQVTAYLRHLP